MGGARSVNRYVGRARPLLRDLPTGLQRRRPRRYAEWKALRAWGKLPAWEPAPDGFLMREAREKADLTQAALAERLGCSQQAIAQAERWNANPTTDFVRRWARACGAALKLEIR